MVVYEYCVYFCGWVEFVECCKGGCGVCIVMYGFVVGELDLCDVVEIVDWFVG